MLVMAAMCSGQHLQDVVESVRSNRLKFPSLKAHVRETILVSGSSEQKPGVQSWGDRSDERAYDIAYREGNARFQTSSFFGKGNPALPISPRTSVVRDGVMELQEPALQTGEIDKVRNPDPCPLANGYFFEGRPIDQILGELEGERVEQSNGTVVVAGTYLRVPLKIVLQPNRGWAASRIEVGRHGETSWSMSDWKEVSGSPVPMKSVCVVSPTPIPGVSRIAKEFQLSELQVDRSASPFEIEWQNGVRVYDRINDRVLLAQGGRLVPDPIFSASDRNTYTSRALLFMGSIFVAVMTVVVFVWRRRVRTSPS